MKRIILLFLLIPSLLSAAKIECDEIDEFTGKRTMYTSWEGCYKNYIHFRFRLQNGIQWLDFKFIPDKAIVIGSDDNLLLKSTSGEIATFKPIDIFSGGVGDGAVGLNGSGMFGISATYRGDLSFFKDNITRLIRINSVGGYFDREISEKEGKKIIKLYNLFTAALNGDQGSIQFFNFTIKYLKKSVNSSNWDIVNEEYKKDVTREEIQQIITDWESKSDDSYEYKCQIKKD